MLLESSVLALPTPSAGGEARQFEAERAKDVLLPGNVSVLYDLRPTLQVAGDEGAEVLAAKAFTRRNNGSQSAQALNDRSALQKDRKSVV